jgi:pimeloyl-ACP methyl ester carboxylesterase
MGWGRAPENLTLRDEAGFITIEPVNFYFHFHGYFSRLELTSSRARMWYTFKAADENSQDKPLFIFFNGGPGGATSSGLMSLYTSRWTLDNTKDSGGEGHIPNPVSWTRLGNLLYIDARQTGFSYDLTETPRDMEERRKEFNAQNYNSFIDGADFIRLLLRFLERHPQIQDNPVIIVGESYGGIRTTVMLYLLLNYQDFANGNESYQDETLVQEIQRHYNMVFPAFRDTEVPPEVIAGQFSHQVLIQPAISYYFQKQVTGEILEQDGSLIYQVAGETGTEYIPCRLQNDPNCNPVRNIYDFLSYVAFRDYYNCSKPRDWLWGFFTNAARLLGYTENLSLVTGMDVTQIPELYASARSGAYRVIDPDDIPVDAFADLPLFLQLELLSRSRASSKVARQFTVTEGTSLEQTFGTLQPWDCYFLDLNEDANLAHYRNIAAHRGYFVDFQNSSEYGRMFLKNVAHVNTFITNAKYDIVVYSPAIPGTLARHTGIVHDAIHDTSSPAEQERPGQIVLLYRAGAFPDIPTLQVRVIRFPFYKNGAHAVPVTEPVELFNDVSEWLNSENPFYAPSFNLKAEKKGKELK